jgi:hypothetical protein
MHRFVESFSRFRAKIMVAANISRRRALYYNFLIRVFIARDISTSFLQSAIEGLSFGVWVISWSLMLLINHSDETAIAATPNCRKMLWSPCGH